MPWQVIDLEESSDKAIHKPGVALEMCLWIFFHRDQDPHCSKHTD